MNITINVSSTSISGVTLICGPRTPPPEMENAIGTRSFQPRACLQHQTPRSGAKFPSPGGTFPASSKQIRRINQEEKIRLQTVAAPARTEPASPKARAPPRDKAPRSTPDTAPQKSKSNTPERTQSP